FLIGAGYRVTIVTHRPGSAESLVPEGATLVQLTGMSRRQRVTQWAQICRRFDVDTVIDHRILYSRDWPSFALAARAAGAATIGWIHNFAG
ncbi:glycosyl transferase family 2, partial [Pseudomonas sp. BGM005]|nr:glycosyl transferase family 2 [Pseudomonas sp. BG5]